MLTIKSQSAGRKTRCMWNIATVVMHSSTLVSYYKAFFFQRNTDFIKKYDIIWENLFSRGFPFHDREYSILNCNIRRYSLSLYTYSITNPNAKLTLTTYNYINYSNFPLFHIIITLWLWQMGKLKSQSFYIYLTFKIIGCSDCWLHQIHFC